MEGLSVIISFLTKKQNKKQTKKNDNIKKKR